MTRMESERATQVAMRSSGQTVMAMVAAGTRTPPTPKPARVPSATVVLGLSGVVTASAPPKAAKENQSVRSVRKMTQDVGHTHHNCRHQQKFPIVSFPEREQRVDAHSTKGNTETRSQPFQADLNGIRVVDRLVYDGEEVNQRVVVHSGNKSDDKCHANYTLPCKELSRDHRDLGDFPLPSNEKNDEGKSNQDCAKNVRTRPRVCESTGSQADQANYLSVDTYIRVKQGSPTTKSSQ
jgi:hypothetical protein